MHSKLKQYVCMPTFATVYTGSIILVKTKHCAFMLMCEFISSYGLDVF